MFIGRNYEVVLDHELTNKITPTEKNYFRGLHPIRSQVNDFVMACND